MSTESSMDLFFLFQVTVDLTVCRYSWSIGLARTTRYKWVARCNLTQAGGGEEEARSKISSQASEWGIWGYKWKVWKMRWIWDQPTKLKCSWFTSAFLSHLACSNLGELHPNLPPFLSPTVPSLHTHNPIIWLMEPSSVKWLFLIRRYIQAGNNNGYKLTISVRHGMMAAWQKWEEEP